VIAIGHAIVRAQRLLTGAILQPATTGVGPSMSSKLGL
jgi:hypothetical protein